MNQLSRYRKTLAALVGGVLAWAQTAYVPDGHVDRAEWYGLAVVLAMAAGVYGIANDAPKGQAADPLESVRDVRPAEAVAPPQPGDYAPNEPA